MAKIVWKISSRAGNPEVETQTFHAQRLKRTDSTSSWKLNRLHREEHDGRMSWTWVKFCSLKYTLVMSKQLLKITIYSGFTH